MSLPITEKKYISSFVTNPSSSNSSFFSWTSKVKEVWNQAKDYWNDVTPHDGAIASIAALEQAQLQPLWGQKKESVKEALIFMVEKKKTAHKQLGAYIKTIFSNLTFSQLDPFLDEIAKDGLDRGNLDLSTVTLKFLDEKQIWELVKEKHRGLNSAKELAEALAKSLPDSINKRGEFSSTSSSKKPVTLLLNFIPNLINTFLRAFTFFDMGREPDTTWEANAFLDIYYKCFMIPVVLFLAIKTLFVAVWPAYLITAITLAAAIGSLFIYMKWLRPCPTHLPSATNLVLASKMGNLPRVIGRDKEIDELAAYFNAPLSDESPLHPILVGDPGVGKSEIVRGFAQKIAEGKIPSLKGKKIFQINMAALTSGMGDYAAKFEQILKRIEGFEKDVIFFFDEVHVAMKSNLFEYLKTQLDRGGIRCIAATTKEGYESILNGETLGVNDPVQGKDEKKEEKTEKATPFSRRFKKVEVKEMESEDIRSVLMDRVYSASEDLSFVDPETTVDNIMKKNLPLKKSVDQLALMIQEVRMNLNQEVNLPELDTKKKELENYKKLFVLSNVDKQKELLEKIKVDEEAITGLERQLMLKKSKIEKMKFLITSERLWKKEYYKAIKGVSQGSKNKMDEKSLLFYHNYGLRIIEDAITNREKKSNFDLKLRISAA
jgi:hypothetical protein